MNAFLAGDIENLINDTYNSIGAMGNTLGNICTLSIAGQRAWVTDDLCVTADDIQWRTNLMTHISQEADLHAVGLLCLVTGNEQVVVLTLQLTHVALVVHTIDEQANEQTRKDDDVDDVFQ